MLVKWGTAWFKHIALGGWLFGFGLVDIEHGVEWLFASTQGRFIPWQLEGKTAAFLRGRGL